MTPEEQRNQAVAIVLQVHDQAKAMNREEGFELFDPFEAPTAFIAALEAQDPPFTVARVGPDEGLLRTLRARAVAVEANPSLAAWEYLAKDALAALEGSAELPDHLHGSPTVTSDPRCRRCQIDLARGSAE